ncbi:MAG TPA: TRAP transporter large permease [Thermoanaerobaculia bacterium]|nr:TRAP transporter large permease [Thermoanaerobaculia bacterium]
MSPDASLLGRLPAGWTEPATLLVMIGVFGALSARLRWQTGIALGVAAWAGAAANGHLMPLRHLVEGATAYIDPLLAIATAMIFMRVLLDGGALASIGAAVERAFGSRPLVLVPSVMLLVMFPGMITGSSTASVLTTGVMALTILGGLGLPPERSAAFVAMGGVLGMVAPPINIPAMIIGAGLDLPYAGFGVPLSLIAFPTALVTGYILAWPLLRQKGTVRAPRELAGDALSKPAVPLGRALLGPAVAVLLMVLPRVAPETIPDPGLPLAFLAAAAVGVVSMPRFDVWHSCLRATEEALPVLGILVGVGAFIQVLTLTGARGFVVSLMVASPPGALIAVAAVGLPLFGAISAFGSASVLGVPLLLALLGRSDVVVASGLSALASIGDLMLPVALAPTLAAQAAGVDRLAVLRRCFVPALVLIAAAVLVLVAAPAIGRLAS